MYRESVGETYVRNAGYNEVADLNDIIILYPQAIANSLVNPLGCWDWYGYTGVAYGKNSFVTDLPINNNTYMYQASR